ncbi:Abi family protein [Megasphaera cerevisiae]|uniref:Abi family protein n=1 Tax=Megasphaera cerevisiae TaxID=39029 RepID=UPI00065A97DD|nr:Abi family protein [Megasphaera cerevisiae]
MCKYKSKLNYSRQLLHLKNKGITINKLSESEAIEYLMENNNLFKLSSYRKNFNKDVNKEKYLDLDFSYLIDLAVIDTRLRMLLLEIVLCIEHFAKVKLLKRITLATNEDGYSIVYDYVEHLKTSNEENHRHLIREIERTEKSVYCRDIYEKYHEKIPVWAFLELITFGSFISFYKFCADRFLLQDDNKGYLKGFDKQMQDEFYMFLDIKHIRNASAHNNCILNDLKTKHKGV